LRRFLVRPLFKEVRGEGDFDTNKRDGRFDVKLSHLGTGWFLVYLRALKTAL
jgi:hypothetical protein